MVSETWSDTDALSYIASYPDLIRAFGLDAQAGRDHFENSNWWERRPTTFLPLEYLASYPDLVSAYGLDTLAAVRHYIKYGYGEGRSIGFDTYDYLAANPDLIAAYGDNIIAGARHYIRYGRAEGRDTTFDAYEYLATNPYLFEFGYITPADAARHYVTEGWYYGYETRFDGLSYVAANPDLIATIGTDNHAAARHYVEHGYSQWLPLQFDGLLYLASNPELIAAIGLDATAATRHFVEHGYAQGRSVHFDPVAYMLTHRDLGQAGLDAEAALRHWITHGYREGRDADGAFGLEQADHALLLDDTTSGQIDGAGDRDWYAIDLEIGARLTFALSGNNSATLSFHDALGAVILPVGTTDSGALLFEAPEGGTYYVVVGGSAPGSYTIAADFLYGLVVGTEGDDNYESDSGVLDGSSNDDLIQGLGGDDYIWGNAGNDRMEGGAGDDVIQDAEGDDQLLGGDGNDHLIVTESWYYDEDGRTTLMDGGEGDDILEFSGYEYGVPLDRVTAIGGNGDDRFTILHALSATVLAGAGNDEVTLDVSGGNQTITLGTGQDVLRLYSDWIGAARAEPSGNRVTDFEIGTDTVLTEEFLGAFVWNWDRASNPFAAGYLKLEQVGTDVVLSVDKDGNAGSYNSPIALLTFENRLVSGFTAAELGFSPDGSQTMGITRTGSGVNDTLYGTVGNDRISGLGGNDLLNGRAGNDRLDGGEGNDRLYDDLGGDDYLLGRGGDDLLEIRVTSTPAHGRTLLLDGGDGADTIRFTFDSDYYDYVEGEVDYALTVAGGAGDDVILIERRVSSVIDAGAGDDQVTIDQGAGAVITLGSGSDLVTLSSYGWGDPEGIRITDFDPTSDRIDLGDLPGAGEDSNPFNWGYARLVQSGSDTLLQIDRDGSTWDYANFETLVTFENVVATSLTAASLGYEPYILA